jgi:hypothetical protein
VKRKPFLLTARHLERMGICQTELIRFECYYPDGAEVTRLNAEMAYQRGFSLYWLLCGVLSVRLRKAWLHWATIATRQPSAVGREFMKYWHRRSKWRD